MANNNSQKLAQQIWAIANDLRGKMDASKFKDYILGVIFYRYLSAKTESYMNAHLENDKKTYREALETPTLANTVKEWAYKGLGYFIKPDNLFNSFISQINEGSFSIEKFEKAIADLTESTIGRPSEPAFAGLFSAMNLQDPSLGQEVSERTKLISKVLTRIAATPFAKDSESGDVLGTAYMILIGLFQSGAGKKGGEFFSPTCACELLSRLTTIGLDEVNNVSDGCAGSGSLLLEVSRCLKTHKVHHYYAQENNDTTYNLLRMNFIMHGIRYQDFTTFLGDTLTTDNFYEKGSPVKFDIQVENPPYSAKNTASKEKYLDDPRYRSAGVLAPKGKADLAFVECVVYHMSDNGRAAILLPHGALFRGGVEQTIRKYLIDNLNVIDAIIGLPANMFHGTGIPVCILYLKKARNGNFNNILFVDASKGFEKVGKNNVLRASDIKRIVDCVEDRSDIAKFSKKVNLDEIRANDYNLNIPRYVDSTEESENWDVYSLLKGGVPICEVERFKPYYDAFTGLKDELFEKEEVSYAVRGDVKAICQNNAAIKKYIENYKTAINNMNDFLKQTLIDGIDSIKPQQTEEALTNKLFENISNFPFVDKYDAYQSLYDEWVEILKDAEIIQAEGKKVLKKVEFTTTFKKIDDETKEVPTNEKQGKIFSLEFIQKHLYSNELSKLEELKSELEEKESALNELLETLTDDEKDYEVDVTSKGVTEAKKIYDKEKKAVVATPLKALYRKLKSDDADLDFEEGTFEHKIVQIYDAYIERTTKNTEVNNKGKELKEKAINAIESFSDEKALDMLEKKWIGSFIGNVAGLAQTIVNNFIKELDYMVKKYEVPYADEDAEIKSLETNLAVMLKSLKGSTADNLGTKEWIKFLGGN